MKTNFYQEKNFLTKEECDSVIQKALPFLQNSLVTGQYDYDAFTQKKFRISEEAHFHLRDDDDVTKKIRDRIEQLSGLPKENQESICVIHYTEGGYFSPHYDYFGHDGAETDLSNQRLYTFLLYLNDDFAGGITEFPKEEYKIIPETGRLVSWNNVLDGTTDLNPNSLHSSTDIISGEKWIATIWVRENKIDHTLS